jgi:hypothetical protein
MDRWADEPIPYAPDFPPPNPEAGILSSGLLRLDGWGLTKEGDSCADMTAPRRNHPLAYQATLFKSIAILICYRVSSKSDGFRKYPAPALLPRAPSPRGEGWDSVSLPLSWGEGGPPSSSVKKRRRSICPGSEISPTPLIRRCNGNAPLLS